MKTLQEYREQTKKYNAYMVGYRKKNLEKFRKYNREYMRLYRRNRGVDKSIDTKEAKV